MLKSELDQHVKIEPVRRIEVENVKAENCKLKERMVTLEQETSARKIDEDSMRSEFEEQKLILENIVKSKEEKIAEKIMTHSNM